jgi:amphi-Trp domain-containing protein
MDIVEIEQKEKVSRAEVASRLRKLATQLAKSNDVKFEQGGVSMTVHVRTRSSSRSSSRSS